MVSLQALGECFSPHCSAAPLAPICSDLLRLAPPCSALLRLAPHCSALLRARQPKARPCSQRSGFDETGALQLSMLCERWNMVQGSALPNSPGPLGPDCLPASFLHAGLPLLIHQPRGYQKAKGQFTPTAKSAVLLEQRQGERVLGERSLSSMLALSCPMSTRQEPRAILKTSLDVRSAMKTSLEAGGAVMACVRKTRKAKCISLQRIPHACSAD